MSKLSNAANTIFEKINNEKDTSKIIELITKDFRNLPIKDKIGIIHKQDIYLNKTSEQKEVLEHLQEVEKFAKSEISEDERDAIKVSMCFLAEFFTAYSQSKHTTPALNNIAKAIGKLSDEEYKTTSKLISTLKDSLKESLNTNTTPNNKPPSNKF